MTIAVGLGFMDFPFSSADAYWRWVAMCEDGGVDSVWQTDRLVSEKPFLECMSAMAALAGATKRLKFGMNVVSLGLRDPLLLAKQCATIDMLSNGRLLPGFGIGSIRAADWQATGADTAGRGRRSNEALEIIARLWTEDAVSFDGEFYRYDNAMISPKPVQTQLPMWLGGATKPAIRRTARFGTGWQAGLETADEVAAVIAAIKLALKEEGGENFEIVAPSLSILAEPPVSVVDQNVDKKGTRKVAEAYLNYLYSEEGQRIAAKHFYRPRNQAVAAEFAKQFPQLKLVTIDADFDGWKTAQPKFFNDGGVFDQIYQAQ